MRFGVRRSIESSPMTFGGNHADRGDVRGRTPPCTAAQHRGGNR